jgi:hypothetical protein
MTLTASTSTLTASKNNLAASILFLTASESLSQSLKRSKTNNICHQLVKIKSFVLKNVKNRSETIRISPQLVKIEAKTNLVRSIVRLKQKRPGCSKILEEQSEAKGIIPTFSKSKVKRIGLFQKFGIMKQSEVNLLKILQDRSKTNVYVPN